MRISRRLKMGIAKVAVITLAYELINLFLFYFNYTLINSPFTNGPSDQFNPLGHFTTNLVIGLIAGVLGGMLLVTVNGRYFRKKSFKFAMVTTAIAYCLIFALVIVVATIGSLINEYGVDNITAEQVRFSFGLIVNSALVAYFILWGLITLLTLFLLQINDIFGPGILRKFLAGKYHQPKTEERIFMFMDLRSSTTIAEKIGNENYFNLLNDLFADITDAILNNEGEIYQYVGDEIVVSWPVEKGIRNANCIRCFTNIQGRLHELASKYDQKYGVKPEFKAGLHYGLVMAGEVGVIKKEIIYSGDVLNTTARIQEQCNSYGVDILISRETFDLISDNHHYELIPLGNIELRGKESLIDLNTIKSH